GGGGSGGDGHGGGGPTGGNGKGPGVTPGKAANENVEGSRNDDPTKVDRPISNDNRPPYRVPLSDAKHIVTWLRVWLRANGGGGRVEAAWTAWAKAQGGKPTTIREFLNAVHDVASKELGKEPADALYKFLPDKISAVSKLQKTRIAFEALAREILRIVDGKPAKVIPMARA